MSWYEIKELFPGVFRVEEGGIVAFFLIQGKERAALIDTGFGVHNVRQLAEQYLTGDLMVINTHVHPDHSNGDGYFESVTMGRVEWEQHGLKWNRNTYKILSGEWRPSAMFAAAAGKRLPEGFDRSDYNRFIARGLPSPVQLWDDGAVIDLGETVLEVFHTPAHTLGSICLLDRRRRLLFTGDTLNRKGPWWLHLKCRATPEVCFESYGRLGSLGSAVDHVLPAHGRAVLPGTCLTETARHMEEIRQGTFEAVKVKNYGGEGYYYDLGGYGPIFAEPIDGSL